MNDQQAESLLGYYQDTERQLGEVLDLVPYVKPNRGTYMPRLDSIIRDACSLIDSICREVTTSGRSSSRPDITTYAADLEPSKKLSELRSLLYAYPPVLLQPFSSWFRLRSGKRRSPAWWRVHNTLKHRRLEVLSESNLTNAVLATCGAHQIIASHPDFLVALMRHDMLKTDMRPQTWIEGASKVPERMEPAFVETSLFVTCVGQTRFPATVKQLARDSHICGYRSRLERYLAIDVLPPSTWE